MVTNKRFGKLKFQPSWQIICVFRLAWPCCIVYIRDGHIIQIIRTTLYGKILLVGKEEIFGSADCPAYRAKPVRVCVKFRRRFVDDINNFLLLISSCQTSSLTFGVLYQHLTHEELLLGTVCSRDHGGMW